MQYSLETRGADVIAKRLEYLGGEGIKSALLRGAVASAILVEGEAKRYTANTGSTDEHQARAYQLNSNTYLAARSLRRITGALANSITHKILKSEKTGVEATVGSNLLYARIHEVGGVIRARHAPFLVFKTDDGSWRRTRQVTMPARPFLLPALLKNKEKIENLFSEKFWAEVDKAGGKS